MNDAAPAVGYAPEEILTGEPTRSARLKWVVVVAETLPAGRIVNAAVCVAAATAAGVPGLLGPDAEDAAGNLHPGLPWAGCTILGASSSRMAELRAKAAVSEGVFVADMPSLAQLVRVYDGFLERMSAAEAAELDYCAVSVIGPRKTVDRLVHGLSLLA
ncbi:hypothetical protein GCM10023194_55750 [Planotetraspora phitsanulokensis]|uniref:DUF2000 domain-containing protein n=1 Tax=Planotetraspora phitsanulokensis TaxID=575192 RepID=A0A8J3UC66_9ACTN|nr:DUF2000 domain-containing protein [Planotetraspora phitsanulokensis]GII41846.1 hypothetical protein Pph01_68490 [Planotetraspora phitsanulokensis]